MDNITNKRILLFCTKFQGYYEFIIQELYKIGAKEVFFVEIPHFSESNRTRQPNRLNINFLFYFLRNPRYRAKWTNELINRLSGKQFDTMFCVADVPFEAHFMTWIKDQNPNIKTYLFLWDVLSTCRVPVSIIERFDFGFSFDKDDCVKIQHLKYLPDFYIESPEESCEDIYDASAIASLTDEYRGVIAKKFQDFCLSNGLKSFIYIVSRPYRKRGRNPFVNIYRYFVDRKRNKFVSDPRYQSVLQFKKITIDEVEQIQNQSRCIFDFSYPNRQGLTLNCISALAKGKKLVTSNQRIKEEPFYNPDNIYIYDYDNPIFDIEFFTKKTHPVDISYLRLDNWLKYILNR